MSALDIGLIILFDYLAGFFVTWGITFANEEDTLISIACGLVWPVCLPIILISDGWNGWRLK
jgi:hypothetical protein